MVCACHMTLAFSFPRSSTFLCAPSLTPRSLSPHSPHAPFSPIRWQRSPRVLRQHTPSDQHAVNRTPPAAAALCCQPPPPEQYSTQRHQRYYTCVRTLTHTAHTQHKSICYSFPPSLSPPLPSLSAGQNLLLFDGCVCKLADFGMAEHRNDCQEVRDDGVKGTYPFLSPEVRAP